MNRPPLSRSLYLALLAQFVFAFGFTALMPVIPLFITDELNAADRWIGTATLFVAWSSVAIRIPGGTFSDRHGRRRIMLIGAALGVLANAINIFSSSVGVFLVARLISGVSLGLYTTANKALVADLAPPSRRGEAMGLTNAAFSLAIVISPLAGEWLKNTFDFRAVFIVSFTFLVLSFLFTLPLPEARPERTAAPNLRREMHATVGERGLWAAIILLLGMGAVMTVMYTFYPLMAERRSFFADSPALLSSIAIGLGLSIWALIDTLIEPIAGRLSDRIGRLPVIIPGLIITVLGLISLSQAGDTWSAYFSIAVLAFGWAAARGMGDALAQDAVAPHLRGMGSALLYTGFDLSVGLSAQLFSGLIDGADFSRFFAAAMISTIAFGVVGALLSVRLTTYERRYPAAPTLPPPAIGD